MNEHFGYLIGVLVAMIGYQIHGSLAWAIIDGIFWPIVLVKWLLEKQLTLTIIQHTFSWFFK